MVMAPMTTNDLGFQFCGRQIVKEHYNIVCVHVHMANTVQFWFYFEQLDQSGA